MDRTAPTGPAARLLAVLAVLLGLLAMHGLAGAHHAPAAAAIPAAASGAGPAGQQQSLTAAGRAALHDTALHDTAWQDTALHDTAWQDREPGATGPLAAVALAALPGAGALDGACRDCAAHGAGALCLAVLSVGLALLARLLARRSRGGGLPAPRLRLLALRPGSLPLPRPPDLVAGLCVSRT